MNDRISKPVGDVRRLLSRCAEQFVAFDSQIVQVLNLQSIADYGSIIDCFYTFEDTEMAKTYVRNNGLSEAGNKPDFGLVYLKFYGLMNACYLQQQAVIVCNQRLNLATDLRRVKASPLIQSRHDFAAHSPNRGKGSAEHSYILDRFDLLAGRVSGFSSNAPTGFESKNASLLDLLSEWDETFCEALIPVCKYMADRIRAAGIVER